MIRNTLSTVPSQLCLLVGVAWPLRKIDIGILFAFGLDLNAHTTAVVSAMAALALALWINGITKPHLRLDGARWILPLLGAAATLAFAFEFALARFEWIAVAAGQSAAHYLSWALDIAVLACLALVTARLDAPWWLRFPDERKTVKGL